MQDYRNMDFSLLPLTVYSYGSPSFQCSIGSNCPTSIFSIVKKLLYWTESEISLLTARVHDHITIKDPLYSLDSQIAEAGYCGILTNCNIRTSNKPCPYTYNEED